MPEQCFYCNTNAATTTRYNKPICNECNNHEFSAFLHSQEEGLSESDKVLRWKLLLRMEKIIEEHEKNRTSKCFGTTDL